MFPPKKKGLDVLIAVGKPKAGPPELRSPGEKDEDEPMEQSHAEPDDDQQGGASDHDADNKIMDYAMEIASVPELAHPFSAFLEAVCQQLRKGGAYEGDAPEQDHGY